MFSTKPDTLHADNENVGACCIFLVIWLLLLLLLVLLLLLSLSLPFALRHTTHRTTSNQPTRHTHTQIIMHNNFACICIHTHIHHLASRVEGELFYGHKIVLVTASPRFQSMLSSQLNDGTTATIQINDIRYHIFRVSVCDCMICVELLEI